MGEGPEGKNKKKVRQKYFVARELQLTIALLVVLALLGGIFLQSLSTALTNYLDLQTSGLTILMIIGYVAIVAAISIFFSHRFVGPFRRLGYEMRLLRGGEFGHRLSIRTKDDIHVRNFIEQVNELIERYEDVKSDFGEFNGKIRAGLDKVGEDLEKQEPDVEKALVKIKELSSKIKEYREKH